MKIFLDDKRPCPEGWILCRTSHEFLKLVLDRNNYITDISMDHDLGEVEEPPKGYNGYQILNLLEIEIVMNGLWHDGLPNITIHSNNGEGIRTMCLALEGIKRNMVRFRS